MNSYPRHCVIVAAGLLLLGGCSKQTPDKQMIGTWTGAPSVSEAVDQGVDAAAQGKGVNPVARGFAKFVGQKLADATMSIEIDFKSGGTVFFRGNTEILGLPNGSDGTWNVSGDNLDQFDITFGTAAKRLHGTVLFRNKDEFTLKLDEASIASIAGDKPKEEPKDSSKDGSKEGGKDGTKDASKPAAPKAPELNLSSIVFKRDAK
jgi:hypothetical protein